MATIETNPGAMEALFASTSGPIAAMLLRAAIRVETTAKRITAGPGSGRTYKRGGVSHTASAPYAPFATDTGRLRGSITHSLEVDALGLVAKVGTDVEYGLYLEVGTRMAPEVDTPDMVAKVGTDVEWRMAPRPFLRPALHGARLHIA